VKLNAIKNLYPVDIIFYEDKYLICAIYSITEYELAHATTEKHEVKNMSSHEFTNSSSNETNLIRDEFLLEKLREEAIIQLKTISGKLAADIGAGTGFMSEGLLDAELSVIAIESSPAMIELMKEKFADIKEFQAVLTDPDTVKLSDETADYAFANMYLHHTEDPQAALKEIIRILKPGGKAAITDLILHDHEKSIKNHQNRWPGFSFPDLYDWFINAGFRNISIEKLNPSFTVERENDVGIIFNFFIACGEK